LHTSPRIGNLRNWLLLNQLLLLLLLARSPLHRTARKARQWGSLQLQPADS
jgi:hypothetical protein